MPALFMTSLIQTAWHKMAVGYSGPCYLDFQTSIFNIHSGPERDTLSVRSICLQVYFCLPPYCVQSVQFSSSEMFQRLLKRDGTKFRKKTILNVLNSRSLKIEHRVYFTDIRPTKKGFGRTTKCSRVLPPLTCDCINCHQVSFLFRSFQRQNCAEICEFRSTFTTGEREEKEKKLDFFLFFFFFLSFFFFFWSYAYIIILIRFRRNGI